MELLKAFLIQEIVHETAQQSMGIHRICLRDLEAEVDRVVSQYREQLSDSPAAFLCAGASCRELVQRMVKYARLRNDTSIDKEDFVQSLEDCGLVFFCRPPDAREFEFLR